jgi:flagellar hook-length control protein FliK
MHIDPIPVAVADPLPPPSASSMSGGGPSFGRFLDNAGPAAKGRAASTNSSAPAAAAAQPAPDRRTAQDASDGSKGGGGAKPQDSSASAAPQPAQSADAKPAVASKSPDRPRSFSGGGRGGKTADNDDAAENDNTCAAGTALPAQLAFVPALAPIGPGGGAAAVSAMTILSKAGKTGIAALVAASADAALSGQASALAAGGKNPNAQAPAAAATAIVQAGVAGGSDAAPSGPSTGFPTAAQSAVVDLATATGAVPLGAVAAPSGTTVSNGAAPTVSASSHGNKAPISAQAAALLGRVSVTGAAQPSTPAAVGSVVTGAAGAQIAAAAANGTAGATVASPAAPATGPAASDATPAGVASGTAAAQPTPLPPVSAAVDLTAKLSAAAIPAHGAAAAASAANTKTELHAATAAAETGSGKSAATPSTDGAAQGAAKPIATAPLAVVPAGPDGQTEDDGASGHAVDATATVPQMRADVAAANAAPAIAPVREAAVNPIAALHSVIDQVAIGLKRGVKSGNDQIQINLEPASLGKIAVRLDFAQDGRVSATFSADRPDTLNLLNNDSRSLEQALRDAGLRTDSGSLTFNLSGGDGGAGARQFAQSANYAATAASMDDGNKLLPLSVASVASAGFSHDGSLDIHV